ncbi:hypothetical protein LP419_36750 [Massilia sp. H-1]|nr:hypothetical protein LP419_36750 [Massilia sp. H-1]
MVETRYRINNFFEKQAESWNLRYLPSNMTGLFYIPGNAARQFPLALPRGPGSATYEIYVDLPDTFDGRYKDARTDYKSPAFDLSEAFSFKGRTASAKVQLQLNTDRVANTGVIEFLAGLKKFNTVLNGYFVIRKSDLRSAATAPSPFANGKHGAAGSGAKRAQEKLARSARSEPGHHHAPDRRRRPAGPGRGRTAVRTGPGERLPGQGCRRHRRRRARGAVARAVGRGLEMPRRNSLHGGQVPGRRKRLRPRHRAWQRLGFRLPGQGLEQPVPGQDRQRPGRPRARQRESPGPAHAPADGGMAGD